MAQQAGGMPKPVVDSWGFALCCGFMAIRWSSKIEIFFEAWLDKTREYKDDQWGLNMCLLEALGVDKSDWSLMSPEFSDLRTGPKLTGVEDLLEIRAFDSSIVGRHKRSQNDSLIFHPRLGFLQRYNNTFYEDVESIHDKKVSEWLIAIDEFVSRMTDLKDVSHFRNY